MSHVFDRYFAKHGHFPRAVVHSGAQRLTVSFCRGYVCIETSSPYAGKVYITRSAWFAVLRKCIPLTKLWAKNPAKDFDVPSAMHEDYLDHMVERDELRRQKRNRRIAMPDPQAQRKRFLAAKARGAKRRARTQDASTD